MLHLTDSLAAGLKFSQSATNGTSLLHAQVQRRVFLSLVEFLQCITRLVADDGEGAGDTLANIVAYELDMKILNHLHLVHFLVAGHLLDAKSGEFILQLLQRLVEFILLLQTQFVCFNLSNGG